VRTESLRDLLSEFPDPDGTWDFEDLGRTEDSLRQNILRSANVDSLTQLARVQGLKGDLSGTTATLLQAKELLDQTSQTGSKSEVRLLMEQGRFYSLSMNPPQSQTYFSKAWELATSLKEDFSSIEAALMLSIIQPPKFQNLWLQRSLELAQTTGDEKARLWLPHLYMRAGWHSFDFRKFEEALEFFKKSLEVSKSLKSNSQMIISMKWSIGRTLRALSRSEEALEIQRELLSNLDGLGKKNGHVYLEIAECLQVLQKHDEARGNFELAYKELSLNGWYSDNKSLELSRIQHLYKKK
jgi:tetratricopeptide (TPR) repeat protein